MLKIAVAGSKKQAPDTLYRRIQEAAPDAECVCFLSLEEAGRFLLQEDCDVLFACADAEEEKVLSLLERVRLHLPALNILLSAEGGAYALAALRLHASGYLVEPFSAADIRRELQDLRYPVGTAGREKRVRAQCFGNFELFVDGRAVRFKYKKTRELAAYLIDRCGAVCSGPEIGAVLWEEDIEEHPEYLKSLVRDLTSTLSSLGCEGILEKQRGGLGIRPDLIECDFYNWKRGISGGLNTYRGEYMSQYSWGEFTNAGEFSRSGE